MSACIVIAVLNGIEIFHKLFMPEMVPDARAIRDSGTVLGMRLYSVQLWTSVQPTVQVSALAPSATEDPVQTMLTDV